MPNALFRHARKTIVDAKTQIHYSQQRSSLLNTAAHRQARNSSCHGVLSSSGGRGDIRLPAKGDVRERSTGERFVKIE
jgi:hypothetical protein